MDKKRFRLLIISFVVLLSTQTAVAVNIEPFFNKQVANAEITSVSVSQDGEYVATLSQDNIINFFNDSGAKIWSTGIINEIIRDVATNGEYVVIGYGVKISQGDVKERGHVRLYSKYNQILFDKGIEPMDSSLSNPVQKVAISSDGMTILVADLHNVYLLDKSGSILKTTSFDKDITGITVSSNSGVVSFGSTVSLYDNIGRMIQSFTVGSSPIKKISISDDGHIAIITPQTLYLYQKDKKLWEKNSKPSSFFNSGSISPDGNWIATGSTNDDMILFDKNDVEVLRNPTYFKDVSTNGQLIAGVKGTYLYLFDATPYINGSISIASTQGAEVYLDEKFVGTAPITISDVPAGNHIIKIAKQGYENWTQNLDISYGEKKEISIMLAASQITAVSTPTPTPTPVPTPTSTPIPDVVMIPKNSLYFITIGIILMAIPSFIYLKKRNSKNSPPPDVVSTVPPINIDTKNEPFIGGNCPYCGDLIKANSKITVCPDCETPHHQECWEKHGGCTTFGCKSAP